MSVTVPNDELRDYSIEIRVRNARILGLMRRAGITTNTELAKRARTDNVRVGELINLKRSPVTKTGDYIPSVWRIADALYCHPDDMFTDRQRHSFMANNRRSIEVSEAEVETQLAALQHEMPDEHVERLERVEAIKKGLAILNPRERELIIARFGLDGEEPKTYAETAKVLPHTSYSAVWGPVTVERVRQMELRALHKLGTARAGLHRIAGTKPKPFNPE